ncbi:response regulator [Bacillus sp. ISL-40]|uniref:hybrid sensor histidine kinase/response regulator n=1 Tax=unclassified Bacillus (in: firmicutes) TaxID=185979 RepID=UPI001BEC63F1|nr:MULTISPECIES: response regulator [unclassified Bacillus (in: firmicutes)]MBT2698786.1 response regulator [Bacillus sp. ISL-40]MBT2720770.1 response regulator [Bacillus sp. ISL-46]MBT2740952.1 response regulator [Bacillus sp. ISL-77]
MKFKTKLYTSIGSLLLLFFIIAIILMNMLEQSTVNMNVVVNDLNERIEMASDIKYETSRIGLELTSMLTDRGNDIHLNATNSWEDSHTNLQAAIESLEKMDKQEKSKELIAKFKILQESYKNMGQQALTAKKLNGEMEIPAVFWTDSELIRQRMIQIADLLYGLQEQKMKNELLRSKDTYNMAVTIIYIYLAIALCIGIGFTFWIIRGMTNNLNKITAVMKSATTSDFSSLPRIELSTKGELGEIAVSFNKMAHALEEQSKLEKQLKEVAEEQSWLNRKIAEIATIYPEVENVSMLAELLITKLVPMVGASYGVFYVKEVEEREKYLKKISAYASLNDNKDYMRFRFGEGLIGQCALEKRSILLTNVPDHYVKIKSGLGVGSPKNIIILPIQFENDVQAVIEIASFESFSPLQVKLLEAVTNNIGIKINSIVSHMKAERLLQESQAMTEELQAQSEELQLQQEELRTTNEKLEEQYIASEQKKEEIEKVREALEEKAQQLELSSQYKSEFLANMSHELRTPLNSLLILAQILAENADGNLTAEQEEYIRTIYSSGNDLLHLINDVLDLAKVESGKLDVNPTEVDLQDVQDFIERQFSPIAIQKNVEFTIKMDASLSGTFNMDEQRLQQILKNLLSNAFKFTETGSVSLVVRKEVKDVSRNLSEGVQAKSMLAFSVIDTGIGIDKDKQDTIFDAFKQADGTTSRQYGGTGLGLSISREMAQLLGGFIEVTSMKGKGSIFTLYLPYYQTINKIVGNTALDEVAISLYEDDPLKDVEDRINQYGISSLKNKKILIVDDDIRNVYALTIALEKYEMDIIVAENGREGIEVLKDNPDTDLILMDIMMPEMDGFEAMRQIRQIAEFQAVPIIALTAKAMKRSREECLEAGATDYISKPINLEQLFSLMQVWLYSKEG